MVFTPDGGPGIAADFEGKVISVITAIRLKCFTITSQNVFACMVLKVANPCLGGFITRCVSASAPYNPSKLSKCCDLLEYRLIFG